jgi:hypothetical protein
VGKLPDLFFFNGVHVRVGCLPALHMCGFSENRSVAYNSTVPTPFYHLSIAQDLLRHPALAPGARRSLRQNWPAFLLGSTAPDVQSISGQSRRLTHFFELPLQPGVLPPWEQMLVDYPRLAPWETAAGSRDEALTPAQAAFIAGYLCHLQADWLWVQAIFAPVFGPDQPWETFHHRLFLHNVLRAYLDRQILADLPEGLDRELAQAEPQGWLPFVADQHLAQWRDFLAGQLRPGAESRTVEVFAARQGLAPEAFYRLLDSEDQMEREVFSRLPRQQLEAYRQRLLDENLKLLTNCCFPAPLQAAAPPRASRGDRIPPNGRLNRRPAVDSALPSRSKSQPSAFLPAGKPAVEPGSQPEARAACAGNRGRRSSS